jgi:hypothetical protein
MEPESLQRLMGHLHRATLAGGRPDREALLCELPPKRDMVQHSLRANLILPRPILFPDGPRCAATEAGHIRTRPDLIMSQDIENRLYKPNSLAG